MYLILSEMRDGAASALSFMLPSEVGDVDGDGMYEILDPWGTPITFLRWAPDYSQITTPDEGFGNFSQFRPPIDTQVSTKQIPNGRIQADPFDPLKADLRWTRNNPRNWQIHDRMFMPFYLATTAVVPNDPYCVAVASSSSRT